MEGITFWSLLRESVIFQGVALILVLGASVYLAVTGQDIPEVLSVATGAIIAYFFTSKERMNERDAIVRTARDMAAQIQQAES